jgi:hypothetical protein
MSRARQRNQIPATSQPRDLDRNRRSELSGSSRFQLPDTFARRRSRSIALRQHSRSLKIIVDCELSNDNCQHISKWPVPGNRIERFAEVSRWRLHGSPEQSIGVATRQRGALTVH